MKSSSRRNSLSSVFVLALILCRPVQGMETQPTDASLMYRHIALPHLPPVNSLYQELYDNTLKPENALPKSLAETYTYEGTTPYKRYIEGLLCLEKVKPESLVTFEALEGQSLDIKALVKFYQLAAKNRDALLSYIESVLNNAQKWEENSKAAESFCCHAASHVFMEIDDIPGPIMEKVHMNFSAGIMRDLNRIEKISKHPNLQNNPRARMLCGETCRLQAEILQDGYSKIRKGIEAVESYLYALEYNSLPMAAESVVIQCEILENQGIEEKSMIVATSIFNDFLRSYSIKTSKNDALMGIANEIYDYLNSTQQNPTPLETAKAILDSQGLANDDLVAEVAKSLNTLLHQPAKELENVENLLHWIASIKSNMREIVKRNSYLKKHFEKIVSDPEGNPIRALPFERFLESLYEKED